MAQSESAKITFDNGSSRSYAGVPVYSIPHALSIWLLRHPDEPSADDQHVKNPQTDNKRRKRRRKETKADREVTNGEVESQNDKEKAAPVQLAIFIEDDKSNEVVMADPDTSPPASKKRRESPRKHRNRTIQPVVDKQTKRQTPAKQPMSERKTYQLRKKTVSSSQPVNAASIIGSLLEEGILTDDAQPNSTTEFPCVNGASVGQSTPSESTQSDTDNRVSEIKISLKWMYPKQQQTSKKFTLPVHITPSQPQEPDASLVPKEKIFVVKLGEFPSIEELLVTEKSTAAVDEQVAEKEPGITKSYSVDPMVSAEESALFDDELTAWEEQQKLSVEQPLVEDSSMTLMKESEITDDEPTGDLNSSQERDFDWTLYDDDEYVQLSNDVCLDDDDMTINTGKFSTRKGSSSVRMSYDIADKRRLVEEAKKYGIRVTARKHNMSFSTLRVWMMQDFGDLPGTKKRLSGGGRRLRYDPSIDIALKDWVLQRIKMKERVTHSSLRKKAMEMILPHNPDFQASQGWITRFLCRHDINLRYMLHGKDAHSPRAKQFSSPSKSQSASTSIPNSAEKVKERLQISLYHQPREND